VPAVLLVLVELKAQQQLAVLAMVLVLVELKAMLVELKAEMMVLR
jgi:hypothetical protein